MVSYVKDLESGPVKEALEVIGAKQKTNLS